MEKDSEVLKEKTAPIFTQEEAVKEREEDNEASIVRIICKEFGISLERVIKESWAQTGIRKMSLRGLSAVVYPCFPAAVLFAKPKKGKGEVFTLSRFLKNPKKFPLISDFLGNFSLKRTKRYIMLIGLHPRISTYLAVTNLNLDPDCLCYQFAADIPVRNEGENSEPLVLTLGEFERVLQAVKRQDKWKPDYC